MFLQNDPLPLNFAYLSYLFQKNKSKFRRILSKCKQSGISFDTVNRTLLTFAEMGLLEIVEYSGDVRRF